MINPLPNRIPFEPALHPLVDPHVTQIPGYMLRPEPLVDTPLIINPHRYIPSFKKPCTCIDVSCLRH